MNQAKHDLRNMADGCGHLVVVGKPGAYACQSCRQIVEIDERYVATQAYSPDGIVHLVSR